MTEINSQQVRQVGIEDEMQEAYLDYAMSVIVGRALPDVKDGLKPVHRRILYAMYDLGLKPNKPHKKSARIVGEVLGKYHPHGDTAVYDAMVRMAQDFSYRYELVDGHGNFGSIDGDSAAAMRYTEAKMAQITNKLLADIKKNTVDFIDNFDGTLQEPEVLPAKIPNLLVNGASGIAVGMSTNIPPHNLSEVIDGVIKLIENPDLEIKELMKTIKGPDFPTGGIIMGRKPIKDYFETGRGKVKLRAKTMIEELDNNKCQIIVNELPYQVNKAKLVEKIAKLVRDDKVEGITNLRDESDRRGMRIVIELKRGVNPQVTLNKLYKHTRLQTTFGIIMLALVDGEPQVLNIKETLNHYINHQKEVITRRTKYDLDKAEARAHILEGFRVALDNIEEVIKIIRGSKNSSIAQERLINRFEFSKKQAKAILDMRLHRLTNLERGKIEDEYSELQEEISYYKSILADESKLLGIIKEELTKTKEKYKDERRTEIQDQGIDLELEDLIEEEEIVVLSTEEGYIKRMTLDTYRKQHRNGKGIIGTKPKEDDLVQDVQIGSTHDYFLFFTNQGYVHKLKGYQIPESSRQARGIPMINLLDLDLNEKVATIFPMSEFNDEEYLFMATKDGIVKKTSIEDFNTSYAKLIALSVDEDDRLVDVELTSGAEEIILATKDGLAIRFSENDVRSMGRTARGVKGIELDANDELIGMEVIRDTGDLLVITEKGYTKRTSIDEYSLQGRGGKGLITLKQTETNGKIIDIKMVDGLEDIVLVSAQGILLRTLVNEISVTGRNTQGVRCMRLNENDQVVGVDTVNFIE
ncbi:DNA gyrase, A subunit [Halobacteroides halobius DSM 5150]|uniref:DNA gyrase subunit A n=1 Tax=Halobacteroides halobius (strain ATCC 35273 / DSM 5150 / MD-1) TaxID=748449 RepID=L0K4U9_HALHC|nr:DNA gyrase subunit A [Halobacteroides halobius]AGB40046.1 DNA gyrase, A subunit [Halobacteroides halobius DSM 5150]